jgi:adenylylsulfate kinase-like enzyme
MKISLSGVPGSGKTDLANAIKDHFESNGETCTVIDGYVEELEKHANLALGFPAAYAGNIHIALERAAHERRLEEEYDHIVTCGTIFESASYVAQSLETDNSFVDSK